MAWPLSQDFNEAIQNPSSAFTDADLKGGKVTTTALGVPLPRSGNYADVYQITGKDGRSWAIKCFTRAVAPDLKDRYAAIAKHLAEVNLPFNVGFEFLPDGVRVKGKAYPAVKMQWVEGQAINTFVKENLNKATLLEAMLSLWVRLCRRLRETGMAHADLQHGNVILVPSDNGKLGLKLVDYDGMFVPALVGKPTGEAGHASYQHPERILTNNYSADLDRFPHLVVATALRALLVGGKAMWDKYDTGDNLLFTAKDFTNPAQSKAMREVWDTGDPFAVGLLSHLVIACSKPLAQTPWLDTLMPEGRPPVLMPSQERQAMQLLGIPVQGSVPSAPPVGPPPRQPATAGAAWGAPPPRPPATGTQPMPAYVAPDLGFDPQSPRLKKKTSGAGLYGAIAAGVLAAIGIGVGIVAFGGKKKDDGIVNNNNNNPASSTAVPVDPNPNPKPSTDPNPKLPVDPVDPMPKSPVDPVDPMPKPPVEPVKTPVDPMPKPGAGKVLWSVPSNFGAKPAFSFDGMKLLVPTTAGPVQVLETAKGTTVQTFREFTAPKQPLVIPQPTDKAISLDAEGTFVPWDTATAKAVGKILTKGPAGTVTSLQTENTGRYVLAATATKFEVIDLDESKALLTGDATATFLSADGKEVLALDTKGELSLLPAAGGKGTVITPGDGIAVAELLAWSPAKKFAAVRAKSGGVVVLDTATGTVLKKFEDTPGVCDFNADGSRFVIAGETGLETYNTATWESAGKIASAAARTATFILFSPDGNIVCLGQAGNSLAAFSLTGAAPMPVVRMPAADKGDPLVSIVTMTGATETTGVGGTGIKDTVVDADYKRMAFTDGRIIRVMNLNPKSEAYRIPLAPGTVVTKLWFTLANTLVVTLKRGEFHELQIYSAATGKPERVLDTTSSRDLIISFAVSTAGTHAAAARINGDVTLYDLATGKALGTIHPHSGKDPAPDNKIVSVFLGNPCTKILVARADRAQLYKIDNLALFTYFPPGGTCVVEDVTDDLEWVAFRKPSPSGPGKTRFTFKHLGEKWKESKGFVDVANGMDSETRFRFLGPDGSRGVTVGSVTIQLLDTVTGAPLFRAIDFGPHVHAANPTPGRKTIAFGGEATAALYAPKGFDPISVVKAPVIGVAGRKPVPDDEALKKAETNIREVYKDLFVKKLPADRRKLGEILLRAGTETKNDDVAKYWLLRESQAIATELADSQMGAKAIDWLETEYDVDGTVLRIALLEKIGSVTAKTDVLKALADTCSEMVEDLAEKGEFDKAIKLGSVGIAALTRANLQTSPQGRDLELRQSQIRKQKDAFEPVKAALDVLKTKADDPAANLTLGKYRCYVQGRWTEGLVNLAVSSDDALKKAAALDVNADAEATLLKKAESWWAFAQTQPDTDRAGPLSRARYWYAKFIAGGAVGLEKATAESRLSFTSGGTDYKAGLILEVLPSGGAKSLGAKKSVKVTPVAEITAADYKVLPGNVIGVKLNGIIVPPTAGRYKITLEGRAKSQLKLFAKPDEKMLINILDPDIATAKRDSIVVLPNKPVAFYMEALLATSGASAVPVHSFTLKWLRPGSKTEEPIPPDVFFHKKSDELTLTEK
ncbi:hypothetical protein BH11PLA2_BH11PLA2_26150 [soil metagenome]